MNMPSMLAIWGCLAISLLLACLSLALHLRSESLQSIARRLRQVEAEIADLADRTTLWMKRDSVRLAREKKAEREESIVERAVDPTLVRYQKKAQIRARAIGRTQ